jgi:diacylglycerol kinase family enzyme
MPSGTLFALSPRVPPERTTLSARTIPAFVNPRSGSGSAALAALEEAGTFAIETCDTESLDTQVEHAIAEGADRIVAAGGDGTVARVAASLVGKNAALAVVPGGTLNHFARDHGIPADHHDAAKLAAGGEIATADVAFVNDRLFLNTSSVGAYVVFVRTRERLERWFGYRLATLLAGFRLLGRVRPFTVELELDGVSRKYRSALVFVGVGERELQLPSVGSRAKDGRRGLHVIVVRGGTWARLVATGLVAAVRGNDAIARGTLADTFVVDRCTIELRRRHGRVAVDGELVEMHSPLEYRIERDALRLVVPPEGDA